MVREITVLGSGTFGVALANHFANRGYLVKLWVRSKDSMDHINRRHHSKKFPTVKLSENLVASTDIREVLQGSTVIISAIISDYVRNFFREAVDVWPKDATIISASKGLEVSTLKRMTEVILDELRLPEEKIAVMSGPNLAKEIASGMSASTVIASQSQNTLDICLEYIHSDYFRVYTSNDVLGVEISGAAKNAIAIAAGMCVANKARLGENERASLAIRGLREIKRLCFKLGSDPLTFSDLACAGDLFVTCSSALSRNFEYGQRIGEGGDPDEVCKKLNGVAEGLNTVHVLHKLSEIHEIRMPICNAVYDVITKKYTVYEVMDALLKSGGKSECI